MHSRILRLRVSGKVDITFHPHFSSLSLLCVGLHLPVIRRTSYVADDRAGPLQEFDLGYDLRLRPNTFLHLIDRQPLSPVVRLPSQVDSRTGISLFPEV